MKRGIGFGLCLLGFAALMFAGLLAMVYVVGTDAQLYYGLQTEAGVLERAGISDGDLVRVDEALARCLKGDSDALDFEIEVFGQVQPAFNEKELIHMEDCRKLFGLLWKALGVSALLSVAALCAGARMADAGRIRFAGWIALPVVLAPLGAFAAWAIGDFNAAFNFFHEVLFTNDLWLLDPSTDLLIRICPSSMFMNMGARIGVYALLWMLLIPVVTMVVTRSKKERE